MENPKDTQLDEKIITAYNKIINDDLPESHCICPEDISQKIDVDEEIVAERLKDLLISGKLKEKYVVTCSEACRYVLAEDDYPDGIWCILLNKRVEYSDVKTSSECPVKTKTFYLEVIAGDAK